MQTTTTAPRVVTKIAANPLLASRQNPNRPLNVAAYCRVSTDAEDQINSYNAQMSYYRDKIMKNPKWRFVDIYADMYNQRLIQCPAHMGTEKRLK